MDFSHPVWLPLLVEATANPPPSSSGTSSGWRRFVRHRLFDRHLLRCIERARCSEIHLNPMPKSHEEGAVDYIGLTNPKAGWWFSTGRYWVIHACYAWNGKFDRVPITSSWVQKPTYDYLAHRWVWFDHASQLHFYPFPLASKTSKVMVVKTSDLPSWVNPSMCMDVKSRKIFIVGRHRMHIVNAEDGQVQCQIDCNSRIVYESGRLSLAIDPLRRLVFAMAIHTSVQIHALSWDGSIQYTFGCDRADAAPHPYTPRIAVHPPTGMVAHLYNHCNICVHRSDGRFVRTWLVQGGDVKDMFVHSHLDVLCIAVMCIAGNTAISFLACSTVFAPPES